MNLVMTSILQRLAAGPGSSAELARALKVSESNVLRSLRQLERQLQIIRLGKTRGTRYALLRNINGARGTRWPIYRVDETGAVHELGTLYALSPESYYTTGSPGRIQQLSDGIPYFLQDARPAGFLGRALPALHPDLELPPRVLDWTDEHFLVYLTRRSTDAVGALIVGVEAMDRHLAETQSSPVVTADTRASSYPEYARAAMAGMPPGSSAQGEHPKFTATVVEADHTQVIVKFSPLRSTQVGQRWADLLVAEHVAHRVLEEQGIAACRSKLLEFGDRVFLESERFDRVGARGRRSVASLFAVDAWLYGRLDSWSASAERLATDQLISTEDADCVRLLDAFGALIANTDRHFGNLTFFDDHDGPFRLAPVYDMLPMLFAPQNDQLVERDYVAPRLTAAWLPVWSRAQSLARNYWARLIEEPRLSREFRDVCIQSRGALEASGP